MRFIKLWVLLFIAVCAVTASAEEAVTDTTTSPAAVLIITSKGDIFDQARRGLEDELHNEYSLVTIEIDKESPVDLIIKVFSGIYQPRVVVLIGNNAIRLYTKFFDQHRELTEHIQVVTILALDLHRAVSGLQNVQGIAYETPMVTALVNFRRVINKPLTKIGVLYRTPFKDFINANTEYCIKENLVVKSIMISDKATSHKKELSKGLRQLIKKDKVEAIWVPNDNILLQPELFSHVWLPSINESKIPVIVGVESLVNPELNFGTYAVIPDPQALGEQAAGIIIDLKDNDWEHEGITIYPAISMYSVLNLKRAINITEKKQLRLNEVNKIVGNGIK